MLHCVCAFVYVWRNVCQRGTRTAYVYRTCLGHTPTHAHPTDMQFNYYLAVLLFVFTFLSFVPQHVKIIKRRR